MSDAEVKELKLMDMDPSTAVKGIMLWRNVGEAQAEREADGRAKIKATKEDKE